MPLKGLSREAGRGRNHHGADSSCGVCLDRQQVRVAAALEGGTPGAGVPILRWVTGYRRDSCCHFYQFLVTPFVGNMKNHLKNLSAPSAKAQPRVPLTLVFSVVVNSAVAWSSGWVKAGRILNLMQFDHIQRRCFPVHV